MMSTNFEISAEEAQVLDRAYNELMLLDKRSDDSMLPMLSISCRAKMSVPLYLEEAKLLSLVRYIYDNRANIENASAKMYRFLFAFFWMYHYDSSTPCHHEELYEVVELGRLFDDLGYFYRQDSAVITQLDCVIMMKTIAEYYGGGVCDNDILHKVYDAIGDFKSAINTRDDRMISQGYANNGWHSVMDYVEERERKLNRERLSNELKEKERERKEVSMIDRAEDDDVEMVHCSVCGEEIPADDAIVDSDGDYYCDSCADEWVTTCDICNHKVYTDKMTWIEAEGQYVCDDCFDRYYETCHHCGQPHRRSDMTEVAYGEYYCGDCYCELFDECCECGASVPRDEAHVDEHGDVYCDDCYKKVVGILPYHDDSVEFEVNYMPGEDELNEITVGIEHEVGCDREDRADNAKQVLARMNQRFEYENVALFEDSSVEGFEIVSQPMTIRYFKEKFLPQYEKTMEWMENAGMVGTDEGGMHIHFRIPCLDRVTVARLNNVLYGNQQDNDHDILQTISRRTPSEFDRWCSTGGRCYSTKQLLDSPHLYRCTCGVRNTVLNYDSSRTDTYELRMFNSTLDRDEYVASVEFVLALVDFVRDDDGRGPYVTLRDFIVFINEHHKDYPAIHEQLYILDVFKELYIEPKGIVKAQTKSEVETKIEVDTETLDEAFNSLYPDGVDDSFSEPLQITEAERNWIAQTVNEIFSGV